MVGFGIRRIRGEFEGSGSDWIYEDGRMDIFETMELIVGGRGGEGNGLSLKCSFLVASRNCI